MKNPPVKQFIKKRVVHYYSLEADVKTSYVRPPIYKSNFQALFSEITKLVAKKSGLRYQKLGEKSLLINEIKFENSPTHRLVKGKLLSIRTDNLPGIIHRKTDQMRDVQALPDEDVFDITHFIVQELNGNTTNRVIVAIEYNQFGARIGDFKYYLEAIGLRIGITNSISYSIVEKDSLKTVKNKIGHISKFTIRIHKDNAKILNQIDGGLATAIDTISREFEEDYVALELKYDIRKIRRDPTASVNATTKSKTLVNKFINFIIKNKKAIDNFEEVTVSAEDISQNDKINAFDLLIDKAKDVVTVSKIGRSQSVASNEMFKEMESALKRQKL